MVLYTISLTLNWLNIYILWLKIIKNDFIGSICVSIFRHNKARSEWKNEITTNEFRNLEINFIVENVVKMNMLLEYFFFEIICCNMTSGRIAVVTPLEFNESKLGICQVALPSNGILQLSYFQPW